MLSWIFFILKHQFKLYIKRKYLINLDFGFYFSLTINNGCVYRKILSILYLHLFVGRSIIVKKGDGSQVKESTDSSTTLEDDDIKGRNVFIILA